MLASTSVWSHYLSSTSLPNSIVAMLRLRLVSDKKRSGVADTPERKRRVAIKSVFVYRCLIAARLSSLCYGLAKIERLPNPDKHYSALSCPKMNHRI